MGPRRCLVSQLLSVHLLAVLCLAKSGHVSPECSMRASCSECVPEFEHDRHCVWCASSSSCTSAAEVYSNHVEVQRKCAGVIRNNPRCIVDESDYIFLIQRPPPRIHPELEGSNHLGGTLALNWPVNGSRIFKRGLPMNIEIKTPGGSTSETSQLCWELTFVGEINATKAVKTNCSLLTLPLTGVSAVDEGIYILRVWITVNPYATNASGGWRISNVATATLDHLRSEFYEDAIFSQNERVPGFPYDTWADDSILTKTLSANLLRSNRHQAVQTFVVSRSRRRHMQWGAGIPRILHQIWWQGEDDLLRRSKTSYGEEMYNQPDWRSTNFLKWSNSWKRFHPRWQYRLWTETSINNMVRKHFPQFQSLFFAFDATIKKIDFARYLILFLYGGVYVDMDFEAFRPIDPLIFSSKHGYGPSVFLSEEASTKTINCAVLGASSGHPFFWLVMHDVLRREEEVILKNKTLGVLHSTGPQMLTNIATLYIELYPRANVRVLEYARGETKWLYPFNADDLSGGSDNREIFSYECTKTSSCAELHPGSFAMHHFSGSWWPEYEKELSSQQQHRQLTDL